MTLDLSALRARLAELPNAKQGSPGFQWTPELDAILLEFWIIKRKRDVCKALGCTDNTARNRYRELTGQ